MVGQIHCMFQNYYTSQFFSKLNLHIYAVTLSRRLFVRHCLSGYKSVCLFEIDEHHTLKLDSFDVSLYSTAEYYMKKTHLVFLISGHSAKIQ